MWKAQVAANDNSAGWDIFWSSSWRKPGESWNCRKRLGFENNAERDEEDSSRCTVRPLKVASDFTTTPPPFGWDEEHSSAPGSRQAGMSASTRGYPVGTHQYLEIVVWQKLSSVQCPQRGQKTASSKTEHSNYHATENLSRQWRLTLIPSILWSILFNQWPLLLDLTGQVLLTLDRIITSHYKPFHSWPSCIF